jgi:hypothetical protein
LGFDRDRWADADASFSDWFWAIRQKCWDSLIHIWRGIGESVARLSRSARQQPLVFGLARVRATTARLRRLFMSGALAKGNVAGSQILYALGHRHRQAEANPVLVDRTHDIAMHRGTAFVTGEVAPRWALGMLTGGTVRGSPALRPAREGDAGQPALVLEEPGVEAALPARHAAVVHRAAVAPAHETGRPLIDVDSYQEIMTEDGLKKVLLKISTAKNADSVLLKIVAA